MGFGYGVGCDEADGGCCGPDDNNNCGRLPVHVVGCNNAPAAGVIETLTGPDGSTVTCTTDSSGNCSLPFGGSGTYTLGSNGVNAGLGSQSQTVTLTCGTTPATVFVSLKNASDTQCASNPASGCCGGPDGNTPVYLSDGSGTGQLQVVGPFEYQTCIPRGAQVCDNIIQGCNAADDKQRVIGGTTPYLYDFNCGNPRFPSLFVQFTMLNVHTDCPPYTAAPVWAFTQLIPGSESLSPSAGVSFCAGGCGNGGGPGTGRRTWSVYLSVTGSCSNGNMNFTGTWPSGPYYDNQGNAAPIADQGGQTVGIFTVPS